MRHVAVILVLAALAHSAKLPSNFLKCNRKQPDLKECVLKATRDAVPKMIRPYKEVNLPSLYPLEIPSATLYGGSGTIALDQHYKNCKIFGFERPDIKQFEFDFEKKTLTVAIFYPELQQNCDYMMDGKILLLDIKGEGPSVITLFNNTVDCFLKYEEVKKNGKTYMHFVDSKLKMEPEKVTFRFDNLFNGDKALGDNINAVLNDNSKEVFADMKEAYVETVNQILIGLINRFFGKLSIEEAFD